MTVIAKGSSAVEAAYSISEEPRQFRCHLAVIRESDGGFSALVLNLPGIGSSGDSEESSVDSACEAVRAAVESYEFHQETIPWQTEYDVPEAARLRWILVDA